MIWSRREAKLSKSIRKLSELTGVNYCYDIDEKHYAYLGYEDNSGGLHCTEAFCCVGCATEAVHKQIARHERLDTA